MNIEITQPSDYEAGVWKIEISLSQTEITKYADPTVYFSIPKLDARDIHSDKGFQEAVPVDNAVERKGKFVDGVWKGHVYTSGVPEEKNPTPISAVKAAIQEEIRKFFSMFD